MFEKIRGHSVYTRPLGPTSVILDLGANRGEFARAVRARFGVTARLVEANPDLAAALATEGFDVRHTAVAGGAGEITFNVARNDEGSSILPLRADSVYGATLERTVTVPARTLDQLVADLGRRIDLVKMDIEGAEVEVLGLASRAVLGRVAQLTVEFHCHESFGFGRAGEVRQLIRRLRRLGFVCLEFSPSLVNVLFLNRRLLRIGRLRGAWWEFRENPPAWARSAWSGLPEVVKHAVRGMIARVPGGAP